MAITPTKAGPYYTGSSSISFGSLRSNFRAQNIDGTFNTDRSPIKASELVKVTSQTATNPVVPDATENSSIPTSVGAGVSIKASHFRNSIKYYYLTQSGTDDNTGNSSVPGLSLSSADWNSNLNKNIRKKLTISETVGSRYNNQPAFSFSGEMCNLTISITGGIYGAGGILATNSGRGGVAMYVNNTLSSSPVTITIGSGSANIYGGGGVGGRGGDGGTGGIGGGAGTYAQGLIARSSIPYGGGGGRGGDGGTGGSGRGYNNSNVTGSPGSGGSGGGGGSEYAYAGIRFRYPQYFGSSELGRATGRASKNSVMAWYSGGGGTGGDGGYGGNGGDWGTGGDPGKVGNTGFGGNPSTGALFLAVGSYTGGIYYSGQSNAGHTNCLYIDQLVSRCAQGERSGFSGTTNPASAGLFGPVVSYDASIGNNPNGTYLNGPASFLLDDNGASGDDWNDYMIFFDGQGGNVYGVYTPLYGAGGSGGTGGLPGSDGGAAIAGSNYSVSGIINTNTIKGPW
jgi:hypothetical protein